MIKLNGDLSLSFCQFLFFFKVAFEKRLQGAWMGDFFSDSMPRIKDEQTNLVNAATYVCLGVLNVYDSNKCKTTFTPELLKPYFRLT